MPAVCLSLCLCGSLFALSYTPPLPSAQQTTPQAPPSSDDSLKKENKDLKDKLEQYKKLEEEIVAQRIADKAESQVMWWLKLGGLAALVLGVVGYKFLSDYGKKLVSQKVESLAKEHVESLLLQEGQRQVSLFVAQQKDDLILFAKQQYSQFITSFEPLGPR